MIKFNSLITKICFRSYELGGGGNVLNLGNLVLIKKLTFCICSGVVESPDLGSAAAEKVKDISQFIRLLIKEQEKNLQQGSHDIGFKRGQHFMGREKYFLFASADTSLQVHTPLMSN